MFSVRTVTQRVRMPPRYIGDREIDRALVPILRGRVLPDGATVYSVEKSKTRRFAEYEPHGASLLDFTVDVVVHAAHVAAGAVVQLVDVRRGPEDSIIGSALALKVTVRGFGETCRHGTPVKDVPWARVRLVEPSGDGEWLAVALGPGLGLPCCVGDCEDADECVDDEEDEEMGGDEGV